jgi:hypothetical protein
VTDFTPEFLDALDDWLLDTAYGKHAKAARLTAAAKTAPAKFRAFGGPAYRRIDLKKDPVTLLGAYLALDESTSSWTKALDLAKRQDPLPAFPHSAFVFERRFTPNEVVLDVEALNHDAAFERARIAFGPGRGGFDHMRTEREVVAQVDRIHLNDVVAAGMRVPVYGPRWLGRSGSQASLRRWLKAVDTIVAADQLRDGEVVGGWMVDGRTMIDLRPAGGKYPVITELEAGRLVCRNGLRLALLEGSPTELSREAACALLTGTNVQLGDMAGGRAGAAQAPQSGPRP